MLSCAQLTSVLALCTLSFLAAVAAQELPESVLKAEQEHREAVEKVVARANKEIERSRDKLISELEKEVRSATRKEDFDTALAVQARIEEIKNGGKKGAEAKSEGTVLAKGDGGLFGDFAAFEGEDVITILDDDPAIYKWISGQPQTSNKYKSAGVSSFVPTGNNHFSLSQPYLIGDEPGQIRMVSFHVYLESADSALMFQANIDNNWNNRVAIDGRASYSGQFRWNWKKSILAVETGKWVKLDIDLIDDLGAKPGSTLRMLAFSGVDKTFFYDQVELSP